jgi:hypothetical protein
VYSDVVRGDLRQCTVHFISRCNVGRGMSEYLVTKKYSFGVESFVFQLAIQTFKGQDIQNYNFACCFVWV